MKEEIYLGKTTFKVEWVNHYDSEGGTGLRKAAPDKIKDLRERYGSQLRANAATSKANGTPTPPKGSTPKRKTPPVGVALTKDDMPF